MLLSSLYRRQPYNTSLNTPPVLKPNASPNQSMASSVHFQGSDSKDEFYAMAARATNPSQGTVCPKLDLYNPELAAIAALEKDNAWKEPTPPHDASATEAPKPRKHITYSKGQKRSILAEIRKLVLVLGIDTDQQALAKMQADDPERQLPTVQSLNKWRNAGIGR